MKINKILIFALIFSFVFVLFACNNKEITKIETQFTEEAKIEIYGFDTLEVGQTMNVTSNFEGAVFKSSDSNIATCTKEGIVTGVNKGTCEIYFKFDGVKYSIDLNVIYPEVLIEITGITSIEEDEQFQFSAQIKDLDVTDGFTWSVLDTNVATITEDGLLTGVNPGETKVICSYWDSVSEFNITITKSTKPSILLQYEYNSNMTIGQITEIVVTSLESFDISKVRLYTDSLLVTINGLIITALSEGDVIINCIYDEDPTTIVSLNINISKKIDEYIEITGNNSIYSGQNIELSFKNNSSKSFDLNDIVLTTTDKRVTLINGHSILGLKPGIVTIKAYFKDDESIYGNFDIEVKKYVQENLYCLEAYLKVDEIMKQMTIEQKIGQMFMTGFSGTVYNTKLDEAITNYNFGNIIYMGENVSNPGIIYNLSNNIQNKVIETNLVPALIATDQEGGTVARIKSGGTHFICEMGMGATGNYYNTFLEGNAIGQELRHYGINVDFAPVMDVNNNYLNSSIGVRSYGDNSYNVAMYGVNFVKGLSNAGVMGFCKHFPGHGNTKTDSHFGLPIIKSELDDLYDIELAPYYAAIYNGLDAIMTAHILFEAIDPNYPATLSKKILTDTLRNELGFKGIIITDSMIMQAITKNFGSYAECAVRAVNAGADIVLYTGIDSATEGIIGVREAVKNGTISIERIDESVRRILLKKYKLGLFTDPFANNDNIDNLLEQNANLNLQFASEAITNAIGDYNGVDKTKKTLIISPQSSYDLSTLYQNIGDNSIGALCTKYLNDNGYKNINYLTVNNKITSSDITSVKSVIDDYDEIICCFENIQKSNYTQTANFINDLIKNSLKTIVVVSLGNPYDYKLYDKNIEYYICTYSYQAVNAFAFAQFLNGEFEATGVSSVKID